MKINLIEFFVEIVRRFSERNAIIDGERKVSFAELDVLARRTAGVFIEAVGFKNRPVAVFMPKSVEALQADLAITYSGNAYMNLDVKNPAERLGNIFALIKPAAVITNGRFKGIIEPIAVANSTAVINVEEISEDAATPSQMELLSHISDLIDTDPYCIINTSGST